MISSFLSRHGARKKSGPARKRRARLGPQPYGLGPSTTLVFPRLIISGVSYRDSKVNTIISHKCSHWVSISVDTLDHRRSLNMWRYLNILTDVNERSDTTRAGIDRDQLVFLQHVISSISNEHGIILTLTVMISHLLSYYHQNTPSLMSSNLLLSPSLFTGIAVSYHGDTNPKICLWRHACI